MFRVFPPSGRTDVSVFMTAVTDLELSEVPLANADEVATFVTAKRRREHLAGRWLLGQALVSMGHRDLSCIEVLRDEHRAPSLAYIQGVWKREPLPSISVGHSGGYAVVALSDASLAIGIDVEPMDRSLASNAFDLMSKGEELAWVKDHPDASMRLWTSKEAVQKAMGLGMHLNPRDIRIPIGNGEAKIAIGKSIIQLENWFEYEFQFALAVTGASPSPSTAEDRLLEETRVRMQAQPDWGVGCKTQRNNA